jgi:hypothetical protein
VAAQLRLGDAKLDVLNYASSGNAILGIRDSGKSYTATRIAEWLYDNRVPFIAFDPIGVWRFLRVAGTHEGIPVVVAGGEHGDLPLTPKGAPEIVRAAMREGVSLIIDLYQMSLSKADWRRIVEQSIRVLLYENKQFGLRHVFLEEASEFCPQVISPGYGEVYAEIEKMSRMGGNALLGYTLINQRAEQVNKAVLELCDTLILHRQKGKNSLTALRKWLDVAGAKGAAEIVPTLPMLGQGECWVWLSGSDTPVRAKVPAKRTFHPDRRILSGAPQLADRPVVSVSAFVTHMAGALETLAKEAEQNDPKRLRGEIARLTHELSAKQGGRLAPDPAVTERAVATAVAKANAAHAATLRSVMAKVGTLRTHADKVGDVMADLAGLLAGDTPTPTAASIPRSLDNGDDRIERAVSVRSQSRTVTAKALPSPRIAASSDTEVPRAQQKILDVLAYFEALGLERMDRASVAGMLKASASSGAYANKLGALRSAGFIHYPTAGDVALTKAGRRIAEAPELATSLAEYHDRWRQSVGEARWAIVSALLPHYPDAVDRDQVAAEVDASSTSGAFANKLGSLRTLGLLDYPASGTVAVTSLLFPDGLR